MKLQNAISIPIILLIIGSINAQSFQDGPARELDGDFPSKWELIKGSSQIMTFQGEKVISLGNNAILTPFLDSKNYLSEEFSLEFDAYFDEVEKSISYQYYQIRFWDGHGEGQETTNTGRVVTFPLKIFRYGASLEHTIYSPKASKEIHKELKVALEGKEALWRHIAINYKKSAFKLFIDGIQILNIPRPKFTPKMISIEGTYLQFEKDFMRAIKNVQINGINTSNTSGNSPTVIANTNTANTSGNNPTDTVVTNTNTQTENSSSSSEIITNPTEDIENVVENTESQDDTSEVENNNTTSQPNETTNENNNENGYQITVLAGSVQGFKDSLISASSNPIESVNIQDMDTDIVNNTTPNSTNPPDLNISNSAQFNYPQDLAVDKNGNVYVADTKNHRIRKITPVGIVSTIAGSSEGFLDGPGQSAKFTNPNRIAVSNSGNIYVVDNGNVIRKITPDNIVSTFHKVSSLDRISDITVDTSDNVYVVGSGSHAIIKISKGDGPYATVVPFSGRTNEAGFVDGPIFAARFDYPTSLTFDLDGNMYVTDDSRSIRKISKNAIVSTLFAWAASDFNIASSIAVYAPNDIYATFSWGYTVYKINMEGVFTKYIGKNQGIINTGGSMGGGLYGIATDLSGNLYIADKHGHKIYKIIAN